MVPLTVFSHPVSRRSSGGHCQSPPMIHGPFRVPSLAPIASSRSRLVLRLLAQLQWRRHDQKCIPPLHTAPKCFIWKRAFIWPSPPSSAKEFLDPIGVLLQTAVPADLPSAAETMQGLMAVLHPLFLAACSVSVLLSSGIFVSWIATKSAADTVRYSAAVFQQLPFTEANAQCP